MNKKETMEEMKLRKVSFVLSTKELRKKLTTLASKKDSTVSDLLRTIVESYINRYGN